MAIKSVTQQPLGVESVTQTEVERVNVSESEVFTAFAANVDPNGDTEEQQDMYKNMIAAGQENNLRAMSSDRIRSSEKLAIQSDQVATINDPNLTPQQKISDAQALEGLKNYLDNNAQEFAMETEMTNFVSSMADEQLENFSVEDAVRNRIAKETAFANELAKLQDDAADSGIVWNILTAFDPTSWVPVALFLDQGGEINQEEAIRQTREFLYNPSTTIEEGVELIRQTADSLRNKALLDNPERAARFLSNIIQGTEQTENVNAWSAVDVAGIGGIVAGPSRRVARTTLQKFSAANARTEAAEEAVGQLGRMTDEGVTSPIFTQDDVVEQTLPSALTVETTNISTVGLSKGIAETVRRNEDIIEQLANTPNFSLLSEAGEAAVLDSSDKIAANFAAEFGYRQPDDFRVNFARASLFDPGATMTMTFGKKTGTGGGYVSEASAQRALADMDVDGQVIQKGDGTYWLEVTRNINEQQFIQSKPVEGWGKKEFVQANPVLRFVNNAYQRTVGGARLSLGDALYEGADLVRSARDFAFDEVMTPIYDTIRAAKDKEALSAAILRTQDLTDKGRNRWLDEADLRSMGLGDSEVAGYYSFRQLSDLDYTINNHVLYKEKVLRGLQDIELPDGRFSGQRIDIADASDNAVFDYTTGRFLDPGELTELPSNKILVRTDESVLKAGGHTNTFIINASAKIRDLNPTQLAYKAGGHRYYDVPFFVKQTVRGEYANGQKYISQPITHWGAPSVRAIQPYVDDMNELLDIYKARNADEAIDQGRANELLERLGIGSFDDMDLMISSGKMTDEPFEIVRDGEFPSAYRDTPENVGSFNRSLVGSAKSSRTDWQMQTGRTVYRRKGQALRDPLQNQVKTLDPYESLSRGLLNALNTGTMFNYQKRAITGWNQRAALARNNSRQGDHLNEMDLFQDDDLWRTEAEYQPLINELKAERTALNTQLNTPTAESEAYLALIGRIADKVGESPKGESIANYLRKNKTNSPLAAAKSLVFHAKMGLFNFSQLPLQSQTALAATAADPKHGVPALKDAIVSRVALASNDPRTVRSNAQLASKLSGMPADEYVEYLEELRSSGILNFRNNLAYLTDQPVSYANSVTARNFRNSSAFFFNEAERFNRATAFGIAWRRHKENFPDIAPTSQRGREMIRREALTFTADMTATGVSRAQRGFASLPMQFASFPFRFFESVLSSSSSFTTADKARLTAGMLLMYGASGMPFADKWVPANSDEYPVMNSFTSNGFFGWLFDETTGAEMAVGERWSPLRSIEFLWDTLFTGDTTILEGLTGPSGMLLASLGTSVPQAIQEATSGAGYERYLRTLTRDINSVSIGVRSYLAYKEGELLDRRGINVTDADISKAESLIFALTGLETTDSSEVRILRQQQYSDFTKVRQEYTPMLSGLLLEGLTTSDPIRSQEIFKAYAVSLERHVPPEFRQEVDRQAWSRASSGLNREQKTRARQKQIEALRQLGEN